MTESSLSAEIDRLKLEIEFLSGALTCKNETVIELELENERLRAVLEVVRLNLADYSRRSMWGTECDNDVKAAQSAVRAALAGDAVKEESRG